MPVGTMLLMLVDTAGMAAVDFRQQLVCLADREGMAAEDSRPQPSCVDLLILIRRLRPDLLPAELQRVSVSCFSPLI